MSRNKKLKKSIIVNQIKSVTFRSGAGFSFERRCWQDESEPQLWVCCTFRILDSASRQQGHSKYFQRTLLQLWDRSFRGKRYCAVRDIVRSAASLCCKMRCTEVYSCLWLLGLLGLLGVLRGYFGLLEVTRGYKSY
jgi:hypothetical protein